MFSLSWWKGKYENNFLTESETNWKHTIDEDYFLASAQPNHSDTDYFERLATALIVQL